VEAGVHSQASPSGICSGQSDTGTGISRRFSVIFCCCHSISAPQPYLIHVSLTLYHLSPPAKLNKTIRT
jgi:hypothetical protein